MNSIMTPQVLLAIALVLIPTAIYLVRTYTSKKTTWYRPIPPNPPPNFHPSTIVDLRIYPVKSCRGISLQSTNLLHTGLELDRQWMFVEWDVKHAKYKFLTIRSDSKMTLINTSINEKTDELVLSVDDPPVRIVVPAHPSREWLEKNTTSVEAEIWSKDTATRMFPEDLTSEISAFLGKNVRLVYKGTHTLPRILRGNGAPQFLGREQSLGFADMMPVLVASLASMKELNTRLAKTGQVDEGGFDIERFRPNVVIEGNQPWEEDAWKTLVISAPGDRTPGSKLNSRSPTESGPPFILDVASRCLRCQVPNVDPDTAVKNRNQPWGTLMKYRNVDEGNKHKPAFGMLCCPRNEGRVEVGMRLDVVDTEENHVFRSPMEA